MVSGLAKDREKEVQLEIFGSWNKLESDSSQFDDLQYLKETKGSVLFSLEENMFTWIQIFKPYFGSFNLFHKLHNSYS